MPDYLVGLASRVCSIAQFLLERLEERPFEAANFLVGLVGVPVLIWHVRGVHKGIETQTRNIQAQTLGCLYNHYFTLCRTLLRRPYLRGYLYDDVVLKAYPANDKRRSQVNTVCEMMTGLLEHAVLQRPNIPEGSWCDCWQPYLKEMYKNRNSELALFFRKNRHFYSTDFQDVVDPLIATKNDTSAAPRQTFAPEASLPARLTTLVKCEFVRSASQNLVTNMKGPGGKKIRKSATPPVTLRSPREILEPIPIRARPLPQFVAARGLFTSNQCETLLEKTRFYRSDSESFGRRVDISYLKPEQFGWVFEKIASVASRKNLWGLALSAISEPMRIQRYRRRDYSDPHSDYDYATPDHSKLTVIVPLVDRGDWDGGLLEIGNSFLAPRMQQGDAVIFPSFSLHRVTPVISGVRIVLSAWISGPPLR